MDNIEILYKNYEILTEAGDNIAEHEDKYKEIINAVKSSEKEKCLAAQFIGKFFKNFPSLADVAIDAQLDLCEDENMQIRRQAIKNLPLFCKDTKEHTEKIGDTLAQLLVLDDHIELQQVHIALQTILKSDARGALSGIFSQISTGDEATREKCFKFLSTKVFTLGNSIITKEIEEYIIDSIKKFLQDVTSEEFHLCMNILRCTKLEKTVTGHVELVKLAVEQAELGADIDAITIEDEIVEKLIQCATHALPYFSGQINSTPFMVFIIDKLLPLSIWNMIGSTEGSSGQTQLRLLKTFAELSPFCGTLENPESIQTIYNVLLIYMPFPPALDDDILRNPPSFQFSHAECLLYALHTLGKKNSEKFAFLNDQETLKNFRSRLQFLARGTQGYIKKLEEAIKGKTEEELKSEENMIKVTALKTTSNISALIRDLFHSPPSFKINVQLSWVTTTNNKLGNKRPIVFNTSSKDDDLSKKSKNNNNDQKVYTPPSGKYSAKVKNYGSGNQGRGQNTRRKF